MIEKELLSLLALQSAPNIGDTTAKKLIQHCGSAEAVFKERKERLLKLDGIGSYALKELHTANIHKEAAQELQYIQDNKITYHAFTDTTYPERLKHCIDGPILLFSDGNIQINNRKIISIVGTRKVTTMGAAFCEQLIDMLSPLNPIIVSGFAYGVDIIAHKAAMNNNLQTIACLAHGLNQIYPKAHKSYVDPMRKNGGFYTDFWSNSTPERENFLKRNRLIAGISEATVVIESAEKGGSLVTADIANSYNREVFAVPGRSTDTMSKGCNTLIKQQKAHLLTDAADLIYMLNWQTEEPAAKSIQKQLFVDLDEAEKIIYNFLMKSNKEQLDIIALKCNMPTFKVASLLLNMELKGVIRPLPGKQFEII